MTAAKRTVTSKANGHVLQVYEGKPDLSKDFARTVLSHASASIASKGSFSVALSGGSLPAILRQGLESIEEAKSAFLARLT